MRPSSVLLFGCALVAELGHAHPMTSRPIVNDNADLLSPFPDIHLPHPYPHPQPSHSPKKHNSTIGLDSTSLHPNGTIYGSLFRHGGFLSEILLLDVYEMSQWKRPHGINSTVLRGGTNHTLPVAWEFILGRILSHGHRNGTSGHHNATLHGGDFFKPRPHNGLNDSLGGKHAEEWKVPKNVGHSWWKPKSKPAPAPAPAPARPPKFTYPPLPPPPKTFPTTDEELQEDGWERTDHGWRRTKTEEWLVHRNVRRWGWDPKPAPSPIPQDGPFKNEPIVGNPGDFDCYSYYDNNGVYVEGYYYHY